MFASLEPFSPEDTALYIDHRTRIAGYSSETPLFTTEALALIARYSEGIPRNINNLCFNALSLGYALKRKTIDCEVVREVATDLDLDRWQKKSSLAAPERGSQESPTFVSAASAPSMFAGLLPKLALVMAIVLAMAGAFFGIHRWAAPKASAQANRAGPPLVHASPASLRADQGPQSVAPAEVAVPADRVVLPLVAAVPSSSSADQGPLPMAPASTVLVTPNRTLLGICVQNFGRCNPELLQEIHRLNPRLRNLDHIESGQRIRIPGSAAIQNITEQSSKASLAERDTQ